MSENSSVNNKQSGTLSLAKKILHVALITAWVFVAFVATQIIVMAAFQVAKHFGFSVPKDNLVLFTLALNAVVYSLALVVTVGVPYLAKLIPRDISLKKILGISTYPKLADVGMAVVAYVSYLVVSALVMFAIIQLIPGFQANQEQEIGFKSLATSYEYILAFLALVVMAPLAEELLFRGYLFGRLRHFVSFIPATIITSLLFGLVHGQWNVGVDVFILSLALCYLREKTQSLWPAIFLHATKNGIAFILLFVVKTPLT